MRLEKEIKQKIPFVNEKSRALVNILFTSGWVAERLKLHFKPFGITPKQYNILRILNGADQPMSTSQIRIRMLDKMSDVTRLIDRMVLKEWITKDVNKLDRRLIDVLITESGKKILKEVSLAEPPMIDILSHISEEDCSHLNKLLDALRD